jgi:hypothetical protein
MGIKQIFAENKLGIYLLVMSLNLFPGACTIAIIPGLGIDNVPLGRKQGGYRIFTTILEFLIGDAYSLLKKILWTNHIDVVSTGGLSLDHHKCKKVIDTEVICCALINAETGSGFGFGASAIKEWTFNRAY